MTSQGYALFMAIKVTLVFILVYILTPTKIIRFEDEARLFLDKLFISLTHASVVTIGIVYLLAFSKLYETFSLFAGYLAAYLLWAWMRGNRTPGAVADALGMQVVVDLLNWSENRHELGDPIRLLKQWFRRVEKEVFRVVRWSLTFPFAGILPATVLSVSAYIRFKTSLIHAAYPHIDAYSHLLWTKYIGSNQFFPDGIYPFGYHAIISSLAKLSFIEPYWLVRFIGPLGGVLLVLSVYYFALRITGSHTASLVSLSVYGLVTHPDLPTVVFRQTAALPQEFAAIFVLPGLYFLWLYLKNGKSSFLLLYAETLAITVFVHPYVTVYLLLWSLVMTIIHLLVKKPDLGVVLKIIVYSGIAGVVSLLPFGLGLLMGKSFHRSSIEMIQQNIVYGGVAGSIMDNLIKILSTRNPFLDAALLAVLVLVVSLRLIRKLDWTVVSMTIAISSVLTYLLYLAPEVGLPRVVDPVRTGILLSPLLGVLYACGLTVAERYLLGLDWKTWQKDKEMVLKAVALLICIVVLIRYPLKELYRGVEEYDAAANNYLRISTEFPAIDWTIVGPPEQLVQVVGKGWHFEILRFVQRFSLDEARDPRFHLPVPTRHIFFFIEKRPLNFSREITAADAALELAPEGDDAFMQYYKSADQRAIIEAKAWQWIEIYQNSHPGVSIFYEDQDLKIYHVEHEVEEQKK